MNIANRLTLLRIALIPLYIIFLLLPITRYHFFIAAFIFLLSSITDALDGRLARKHNIVTDFGKFADPLADKLVVLSAMVCFVQIGLMPAWVCIIIMAREIIISGFRLICAGKGNVVAASWFGKIKTISQMIFVIISSLNLSYYFYDSVPEFCNVIETIRIIIMYIALALTILSLIDYFIKNKDVISFTDL